MRVYKRVQTGGLLSMCEPKRWVLMSPLLRSLSYCAGGLQHVRSTVAFCS